MTLLEIETLDLEGYLRFAAPGGDAEASNVFVVLEILREKESSPSHEILYEKKTLKPSHPEVDAFCSFAIWRC